MRGFTGIVGALLGAGFALAMCGWEQAAVRLLGVGGVATEALPAVLGICAALGAAYGGLGGLAGLRRGRWMLFTTLAAAGWLLSGRAVGLALDDGVPPAMSAAGAVSAALLLAMVSVLLVRSQRLAQAMAIGLSISGLAILLVNQHWLGAPLSRVALLVDALLVSLGAVLGSVCMLVLPERGVGLWPLALVLNLLGWGLAWRQTVPVDLQFPSAGPDVPPVVLVVVDTLRFDRLDEQHTPQLWAWGQDALRFVDATAGASWTLPSVATLVTGLPPWEHGAGVHDKERNLCTALAPVPLVTERLRDAGWAVAGVTTNPWTSGAYGFARGAHHWDERLGPGPVPVGLHGILAVGLPVPWPAYRSASEMLAEADALLDAMPPRGSLLLVHLMDVHGPYDPTTVDPIDPSVGYDAAVSGLDAVLGPWLEGLSQQTRVVLVSDHGEELSEHRRVEEGVPDGTRHGHTLYQELLHVPIWVAGPGVASGEVRRPVGLDQVAATVLSWAALEASPRQAPPLAEAVGVAPGPDRVLQAGAVRFGPRTRAVRLGSHKQIEWQGTRRDGRLFDLSVDPGEQHDVRGSVPEVEAELDAALATAAAVPGPDVVHEAQVRDLLQRLGYTE